MMYAFRRFSCPSFFNPSTTGAYINYWLHSGAVVKRMKAYDVRSYIPEKRRRNRRAADLAGKQAEQQAVYANRRRVGASRQEFTAATGELVEALRAQLRDGRDAALSSARTGKHSEAAVSPRGRFNLSLILRKPAGRGQAAEWKNRFGQACFDLYFTLPCRINQKRFAEPNLCVLCQCFMRSRYPTMSRLQEIRYLHPGLLRALRTSTATGSPDVNGQDVSEVTS